jgi:RHS repeat-associated protein
LVTYNYNGLDTVVGTTLDEPDVMSKQFGGSSGSYPDLDRFDRVTTSKWTKDLATDRDFYKVDLAYDRNSSITSAEDQVHTGFDVLYTNDSLNRLVRADEGTLSGGSITSRKRDQQWTLNQTGNWELDKVDLNGDGDFVDANELNDDRTHNAVNELTARDTDDNGSDNFSFAYDEAGNLTDDGESYKYEWDAFYRLRKVKNRSNNALVAEYKYNGLGYRISIHEDTDSDGDVDGSDKWYHHAFDERWRWVATYREIDTSPKEEYLHHAAGLDGRGTGSYIDLVIYRDRDINSGWTSAADGVLEERLYYCQNWRADVSAIVTDAGQMKEWGKYSAYGVPFGLPGGDTNSDGDCDSGDVSQVNTWVLSGPYDVRGDIDLDGDVDHTDSSTISGSFSGIAMGRGKLSATSVRNMLGFVGYEFNEAVDGSYSARIRHLSSVHGRWRSRDPIGYEEGQSLYEYVGSSPVALETPLSFGGRRTGSILKNTLTLAKQYPGLGPPPPFYPLPTGYRKGCGKLLQVCYDGENAKYEDCKAKSKQLWEDIKNGLVDPPYGVSPDEFDFELEMYLFDCLKWHLDNLKTCDHSYDICLNRYDCGS